MSVFTALVVAFVVIVAKIPTSGCHCQQERAAAKSGECPFKKLRQLAACLIVSTPIYYVPLEVEPVESPRFFAGVASMPLPSSYRPRGPPLV